MEPAQEADPPLSEAHDPFRIWQQLPPEIALRIIDMLPQNEVACTVRLVNKAAAAQLRGPRFTTVLLSRPVPPHAFLPHWDRPDAARGLTLKQRRQLLRLTARSGCVANLEVVLRRLGCPSTPHLLAAAASAAQQDACLWLLRRGCRWSEAAMRVAAATGDATFCAWLIDAGCPFDDRALAIAAAAGHRPVCEVLVARGCPWHSSAPCAAAAFGHVDIVDWLLTLRPRRAAGGGGGGGGGASVEGILSAVAYGCDLATLQRLHEQLLPPPPPLPQGGGGGDGDGDEDDGDDFPLPPPHLPLHDHNLRVRRISSAIGSPTLDWRDKVEWLLGQGYPLAVDCWRAAASRPDWPERLEWLRERGLQPDVRAAVAAARAGRVDGLLKLLAMGVRIEGHETALAVEAVGGGHLELLQALHERGLRWDQGATVQHAAAKGHAHVVRWLLDTFGGGGGSTAAAAGIAAGGGGGGGGGGSNGGAEEEEQQQQQQQRRQQQRLAQEAATGAAGAGSMELLTWLHGRGCRFSEHTFAVAAEWGSEEMLEWLVEKGCPMGDSGEPYIRAARTGDLATLRCLRALGCPWSPSGATFTRAVAQGCGMHVLQWLQAEGCPVNWAAAWREAMRPWRKDAEVLDWIRAQRRQAGLMTGTCLRLGQRLQLRLDLRLRLPGWCGRMVQLASERLARLRDRLAALAGGPWRGV